MKDDTEQSTSVDARQSDKAYPGQQVVERLRKLADAIEPDEAKAAVQRRSGDGLLLDVAGNLLGTIDDLQQKMRWWHVGFWRQWLRARLLLDVVTAIHDAVESSRQSNTDESRDG